MTVYAPMLNNLTLGRLFVHNMHLIGRKTKMIDPDKSFGSTDFGNISQLYPGFMPRFVLQLEGDCLPIPQFAEAAVSEKGYQAMLDAAKALSMTVADLLADPAIVTRVKLNSRSISKNNYMVAMQKRGFMICC